MKRLIDTSEVLGTVETRDGRFELCASAQVSFDEGTSRMIADLDSYLRPSGPLAGERHVRAEWLPPNATVRESIGREECHAVARDIFQRWVQRVRRSAPSLHQP